MLGTQPGASARARCAQFVGGSTYGSPGSEAPEKRRVLLSLCARWVQTRLPIHTTREKRRMYVCVLSPNSGPKPLSASRSRYMLESTTYVVSFALETVG